MAKYTQSFSKGPAISVHIVKEGDSWRVLLKDAPHFSLCAFADIEPSTRDSIALWMELYSQKSSRPVDFLPRQKLPVFSEKALKALEKIPFGKTCSYSELAFLCGSPKAARAIGTVCHKNLFPLFIPCHRIISQAGTAGGYAFDLSIKKKLLQFES
jgi:O-6-methylguanine DNA methyltransferase